MKKLLLFFLLSFVKLSNAQVPPNFSASLCFSENYYLGFGAYSGINARAAYTFNEKGQIFVGFNYSFARNFSYNTEVYANSILTSPNPIKVDFTNRIQLSEINFGYRLMFGYEEGDDFNFYLHVGGGIVFISETVKFADYNHTLYTPNFDEGKLHYLGVVINGGGGFQYKAWHGYAFIEPRISFPLTKVNSEYIQNPIPFSFGSIIGYRIIF